MQYPPHPLHLPASSEGFGSLKQRLGDTAEFDQRFQISLIAYGYQFAIRKWMQAVVVIAPVKRITTLVVIIKPRRPGNEKRVFVTIRIVKALDQIAPALVFVHFIEDQTAARPGEYAFALRACRNSINLAT